MRCVSTVKHSTSLSVERKFKFCLVKSTFEKLGRMLNKRSGMYLFIYLLGSVSTAGLENLTGVYIWQLPSGD